MGIKTSKALWVGRGKVVRLQQRLSIIWWLTYEYKNKMSIYAIGRKLVMINKWSWTTYESNITPPCSLLKMKRDGHGYSHGWCVLFWILCQVFYNRTLTNSNLPHNRGHGFRKIITVQGCPNLVHHKLSRSAEVKTPYLRDNPIRLGIPMHKTFRQW